jgi:methylamine dehydrogenase heavy chain
MNRKLVAALVASVFFLALVSSRVVGQDDPRGTAESIHEEAKDFMGEQHNVLTLPPADPHRLYVVEPIFPVFSRSKTWVIDGNKMKIVGMFNGGAASNLVIAPDHSKLYWAETYWSRGDRGERTDVITQFDAQTLTAESEAILENGRFLVVIKRFDADISPDGRYVYSYNMAPSTAISVVDTSDMSYKGELEVPGCALVFPSAPRRFSSLCADGTLMTVSFDDGFNPTSERSERFFDAENDPVFEHPAFDKENNRLHFLTYEGNIITADLSPDQPSFQKPWSILSAADRKGRWRPGGWMPISFNAHTNRLYVLMHRGLKWTHKQAGEEVWVYNMTTRKRIQRIKLGDDHSHTMKITNDENPILFTLTETAKLISWNPRTGKERGRIEGLGISPYVLMADGD